MATGSVRDVLIWLLSNVSMKSECEQGVEILVEAQKGSHEAQASDRYAIVVSQYNISITRKLLEGAWQRLLEAGVAEENIEAVWVPGAWEIPLIAQRFAKAGGYSAVICLGAVIKGETTHDEHINRQVSHSLGQMGLDHDLPILFGILTCNTMEQAIHRSGGNVGNKGEECATAALEMVNLLRTIC